MKSTNTVDDFSVGEVAYTIQGEHRLYGYSGIIGFDCRQIKILEIDLDDRQSITAIDSDDGVETIFGVAAVKKYNQTFNYIVDELTTI